MAKHSGEPQAGDALRRQQAMRLRWLRERKGATQEEAAAAAGVTRDSWLRMESLGSRGSRIDAVTLQRFCQHYRVPGEYVLSGQFTGLDRELVEELVALEQHVQALAAERTAQTAEPAPSRTSKQKSSPNNAQRAGRALQKA